jgi:hypothetical protein
MEVDWECEVASAAPVIDAAWSGYVDLRSHPERACQLPETSQFPPVGEALMILNAGDSPVWTAKCDPWEPEDFDPDELDASHDSGISALACYIDLLPVNDFTWPTVDCVVHWCRRLSADLRPRPIRQCRADLVIRRAFLTPNEIGLGITAYLTGCGATADAAGAALVAALRAFAPAVRRAGPTMGGNQS